MSKRPTNDSTCAICGLRTQAKKPTQLCFWSETKVWLWVAALLCRPCNLALRELFR